MKKIIPYLLNIASYLIVAAILYGASASAQNCVEGWKYTQEIVIDNSGNQSLTNYQVILEIPTDSLIANNKMQANGEDIRFTLSNCCDALPYNIEENINTAHTRIVVKVPFIKGDTITTINMFYGNPEALAASSPDMVYEFWDNFDDGNFDTTKWDINGTMVVDEQNGTAKVFGDLNWPYISSKIGFDGLVRIRDKWTTNDTTGSCGNLMGYMNTDKRHTFRHYAAGGMGTTKDNDIFGGNQWYDVSYPLVSHPNGANAFYRYEILAKISQSNIFIHSFCNTTNSQCNNANTKINEYMGNSFYYGYSSGYNNGQLIVDYVYITKGALNPPTYSLGTEQSLFTDLDLGGDTVFCQGGQVILDPGTWTSYEWSTGSTDQTIIVASTGQYFITVSNSKNCQYTDTIEVGVNDLPAATFTYDSIGLKYTFYSDEPSAQSWLWDFGDGDTASTSEVVHAYLSDGEFPVCLTVTDMQGCVNMSCDTITIDIPSGIENLARAEIKLYPNPANKFLTIENGKVLIDQIQLYDLRGKLVFQQSAFEPQNTLRLDVSKFTKGTYLLQLQTNNQITTEKIIIN